MTTSELRISAELKNQIAVSKYDYYYPRYGSDDMSGVISHAIVTDNKGRLAYIQYDSLWGYLSVGSVHKPCVRAGTGFNIKDEMRDDSKVIGQQIAVDRYIAIALETIAPSWARDLTPDIRKYSGLEEYKKLRGIQELIKL